jgi:hypothetical protein
VLCSLHQTEGLIVGRQATDVIWLHVVNSKGMQFGRCIHILVGRSETLFTADTPMKFECFLLLINYSHLQSFFTIYVLFPGLKSNM